VINRVRNDEFKTFSKLGEEKIKEDATTPNKERQKMEE
jgi:hypothetical protein